MLALADLEHFKQINDRHGHAAGDLVLRHVAVALRQAFRRNDVIARYGGEEFVILFPEAELAAATERLERFRSAFAERPVLLAAAAVPVTLSMGLSVFRPQGSAGLASPRAGPSDGEEPSDLLARADQRLYAAKQAGRNRLQGP